jgi:hypothetical protein
MSTLGMRKVSLSYFRIFAEQRVLLLKVYHFLDEAREMS